jgi:hypothetical protein
MASLLLQLQQQDEVVLCWPCCWYPQAAVAVLALLWSLLAA